MLIFPPYAYSFHGVLCLCAVTPDANDLHSKRGPCKNRLNALSELPPFNSLPHLLAVDIVALCFQI